MRITAIIPVFNAEAHLAQSIDSLLAQTRLPDEIFVVDDCSTDNTAAIVRTYADRGVRLLSTPKNGGGPVARNVGIAAATGDVIVMLDGDDLWEPNHVEIVTGLLEKFPQADLAFSLTQTFGSEDWVWPKRMRQGVPLNCFWQCMRLTIAPHMNLAIRRSALLAIGCYRPHFRQSNDFELFLRMSEKSLFVCTHQITSRYRKHAGAVTIRNPRGGTHGCYLARHEYWLEHKDQLSPRRRLRLALEIRRRWLKHLNKQWELWSIDGLQFHLRERHLVPRSFALSLLWRGKIATLRIRKLKNRLGAAARAWLNHPTLFAK